MGNPNHSAKMHYRIMSTARTKLERFINKNKSAPTFVRTTRWKGKNAYGENRRLWKHTEKERTPQLVAQMDLLN